MTNMDVADKPFKEQQEEDIVQQEFQSLLDDYLSTKHRKRVEIITKAFNFANQAHKGVTRRSGDRKSVV